MNLVKCLWLEWERWSARIIGLMKRRSFSLFLPIILLGGISLSGEEKAGVGLETSLKPRINEKFLDPELKVDDWLFGHVRAGKQVFRKEIEDAGLTFVEELKIDGFKENYFLRFRKD